MAISETLARAIINPVGPDIVGSFEKGQEATRVRKTRTLAGEAIAQRGGQPLIDLGALDPKLWLELATAFGSQDTADLKNTVDSANLTHRLLKSGNADAALSALEGRAAQLKRQNRPDQHTARLIQQIRSSTEGQAAALTDLEALGGGLKDLQKNIALNVNQRLVSPTGEVIVPAASGAEGSDLTTKQKDFRALLSQGVPEAEARALIFGELDAKGQDLTTKQKEAAGISARLQSGGRTKEESDQIGQDIVFGLRPKAAPPKSFNINDVFDDINGVTSILQADENGVPQVVNLTGLQSRKALAKQKADAEVSLNKRKKLDEGQIQTSQAVGKAAFLKLPNVIIARNNINNAINALKSGADTGFIAQFLPNIRNSSILLSQARSAMGLDVVRTTTFGPLSKGELNISLLVAMPENLSEEETIKFLEAKLKLLNNTEVYLTAAATFLTDGGKISDFIKQHQAEVRARSAGGEGSDISVRVK